MKIRGAVACMAVVSLLHFTQVRADVYQSGDLIVTDNHRGNYHGVVLDINRITGAQRVIASIEQPSGVCIDASGDLIVADYGGPVGDNGRIIRIDHQTGQQSVVSIGGMMYNPSAVAVDPSGQLLVAARTQDQLYGTILKIDPSREHKPCSGARRC